MISDKELDEMQARCEALTEAYENGLEDTPPLTESDNSHFTSWVLSRYLIAAARTDLPRCIEEIKRLTAERDKYKEWAERQYDIQPSMP